MAITCWRQTYGVCAGIERGNKMIKILLWLFFAAFVPYIFTKKKGEISWVGIFLGTILGTLILRYF